MLLAALLAMMLVASAPAWAQQTSGPATANPSVDAAGAGNVCVQQVQNVNTGNVSQEQAAANINAQIGALQVAEATQIEPEPGGSLHQAKEDSLTGFAAHNDSGAVGID